MERNVKIKIQDLNQKIQEVKIYKKLKFYQVLILQKEAEATEKYGYKLFDYLKVSEHNMYEALKCFNELNNLKSELIKKMQIHIELRKEGRELFRYLLRTDPELLINQCHYIFHH